MSDVAALVRIVIEQQPLARTVRLPDLPHPGELIELSDGTRIVVSDVEPAPRGRGIIAAEVHARPAT